MGRLYKRVATVNINGREFSYPPFAIEFTQDQKLGVLQSSILKLYNPSTETIKVFEPIAKGGGKVTAPITVSAGYEDNFGSCIVGEAIEYKVTHEGVDRVLEVKISDATSIWTTAIINRSFKNMRASFIIRQICESVGIKPGEIGLQNDKFYPVITLTAFNESIRRIVAECGSDLFFKNGLLNIRPTNESSKRVTLLASDSGLLFKPEKTTYGYKIKTLFLYNLSPGDTVHIKSNEVDTIAKIILGRKTFSTFQDSYCEFEIKPI